MWYFVSSFLGLVWCFPGSSILYLMALHTFLSLNIIPLWYVPRFVQPSTTRHLDWLHLLAIVNNIAINMCVQGFEHLCAKCSKCFKICLGMELLGLKVIVSLPCEEHQTVSHSAVCICTVCKEDLFFPFLILPLVLSLGLCLPQRGGVAYLIVFLVSLSLECVSFFLFLCAGVCTGEASPGLCW